MRKKVHPRAPRRFYATWGDLTFPCIWGTKKVDALDGRDDDERVYLVRVELERDGPIRMSAICRDERGRPSMVWEVI